MLPYIHGSTFYLFFVLPKMEAPNFESIFECISDGVNKVLVLVLVLVLVVTAYQQIRLMI